MKTPEGFTVDNSIPDAPKYTSQDGSIVIQPFNRAVSIEDMEQAIDEIEGSMGEAQKKAMAINERAHFAQLCDDLEHWETDPWAADAILDKEILTGLVLDPCCGTGIMAEAAFSRNYTVKAWDIHDWGYKYGGVQDFLAVTGQVMPGEFSVFMNPPFSLAERFVDKAHELGARKIVCFQRFAWYEGAYDAGKKRGQWWEKNRPSRIWICGDRANCWRHDIPADKRGSGTKTAHAFFVWERGHEGTQVGHIYKNKEKF